MIAEQVSTKQSSKRTSHQSGGAAIAGSPRHSDVPQATGGYSTTTDLDLASTSLEQCRRLGFIPLQFIRWNPNLLATTIDRGPSRSLLIFKRTVDLLCSVTLGVLLLPLLPLIMLAIKLDSPGPVFYSQTRLGKDGRQFCIHKFRSMMADAEAGGAAFATQNDARVTRFGWFMRRTRIDELPQLWCVIRGDMSIVGPRPERPEHMARIESEIPEFPLRLAVKPGLTGWAQISYRYASTIEELRTKLEYDLYYIQFATIWMEIRILLHTVRVVLRFKGQ